MTFNGYSRYCFRIVVITIKCFVPRCTNANNYIKIVYFSDIHVHVPIIQTMQMSKKVFTQDDREIKAHGNRMHYKILENINVF